MTFQANLNLFINFFKESWEIIYFSIDSALYHLTHYTAYFRILYKKCFELIGISYLPSFVNTQMNEFHIHNKEN